MLQVSMKRLAHPHLLHRVASVLLSARFPPPRTAIITSSLRSVTSEASRPPLVPKTFPSSGFGLIDSAVKFEEERLPDYRKDAFYPVTIGQVFVGRYQVVGKMGYGTTSTVWMARDLQAHGFVVLKVHVHPMPPVRELEISRYLDSVEAGDHPGREIVRTVRDTFELQGTHGPHEVFVLPPLGVSLRHLQGLPETGVHDRSVVIMALQRLTTALNFLHGPANVTHTDIHADNILFGVEDESVLKVFEETEMTSPSPRKVADGVIIHQSLFIVESLAPVHLCDLGHARIGDEHQGIAMLLRYRAPEVILGMSWGHAVDMWSVGMLAWTLLEPEELIQLRRQEDEARNDALHLAQLTALLGPPPPEFLERSPNTKQYWDADGTWKNSVPVPKERTFEALPSSLEDADRKVFLDLIRRLLCWLPEDRLSSNDTLHHPWVSEPSVNESTES